MEDQNKIFVVAAVLSIILIGIAVYLFVLDRKMKQLEKKINEDQS